MKFFSLGSLVLGLFVSPAMGFAMGPGASGGGKGVVCRDAQGGIQTAEILEFWEAREIHRLNLQPSRGSMLEMLDASLNALSESMYSGNSSLRTPDRIYRGSEALSIIFRGMSRKLLQPDGEHQGTRIRRLRNARLTLTPDSYEPATPASCAVEQIVRYEDYKFQTGSILINQDIFERLDEMNQAGLIAHEVLYKWLRDTTGETSSLRVRRAIGLAFSGHKFTSLDEKNLSGEYYECVGKKEADRFASRVTRLYIFPLSTSEYKMMLVQAADLGGLKVLDTPLMKTMPDNGATIIKDFRKLPVSGRGSSRASDVVLPGIVQPELHAEITVDRSSDGKADISVSFRPSLFHPNGWPSVKATCVMKNAK